KALQSELWFQAEAAAKAEPTPITASFIQALNEMMDASEKRMAALENRIPVSVWLLLTVIGMMTCLMFGFALRRRSWLISLITPLMIAVVIGLIADLDSPRSGLIRTDLRSLERVELDLASDTANLPAEVPH